MGLLSGFGSLLGIGGNQGSHYQAPNLESNAGAELQQVLQQGRSSQMGGAIDRYSRGEMSLDELLKEAGSNSRQLQNNLVAVINNPIAASKLASEQVMNDPLSKGFFGEGGSQDRAFAEEKDLASRGFSLQPEDYEAYGQASGDITRMFGQQEQSLAQALADRGLAAGSSGIAQQQFSGLQGNKAEQLGKMQMDIAQRRMQTNMQRLNDTRNYLTNLGGLGQQALQNQFGRNRTSVDAYLGNLHQMAGRDVQKYSAEQSMALAAAQNQQARETKNLGDAISSGIYTGTQGLVSSAIASGGGANPAGAMSGGGGSAMGGTPTSKAGRVA